MYSTESGSAVGVSTFRGGTALRTAVMKMKEGGHPHCGVDGGGGDELGNERGVRYERRRAGGGENLGRSDSRHVVDKGAGQEGQLAATA